MHRKLDQAQLHLFKRILGLPKSAADEPVYLLLDIQHSVTTAMWTIYLPWHMLLEIELTAIECILLDTIHIRISTQGNYSDLHVYPGDTTSPSRQGSLSGPTLASNTVYMTSHQECLKVTLKAPSKPANCVKVPLKYSKAWHHTEYHLLEIKKWEICHHIIWFTLKFTYHWDFKIKWDTWGLEFLTLKLWFSLYTHFPYTPTREVHWKHLKTNVCLLY